MVDIDLEIFNIALESKICGRERFGITLWLHTKIPLRTANHLGLLPDMDWSFRRHNRIVTHLCHFKQQREKDRERIRRSE